jgi:type I restriction enzyme S subunit
MSEWKEYKLGQIIDVRDGTHDSPKQKDYGKPLVTSKHIKGGKIDLSTAYLISIDDFDKINKRSKVDKWDVLFSMIGTIGEMVIVKEEPDFAIKNVGLFKAKDEYTSKWIYYYLKSPKAQTEILSSLKGSTQQYISLTDLRNFPITFPSIKVGLEIIQILSSLDDKIELNNKINKELETLAQTLFKQWFIDFEFPNENGEPYKSSGGEMVDSELGEIPKGWAVKNLKDISRITIGRTPPRQEHQWFSTDLNDVKWISIRDMGNCGTYIHSTSEFLTEEAIIKFNIPIIDANTLIMSFKLTVGRISITTERMLSNEAIAHLNLTNSDVYPEFLFLFLKQFNFDSLGSTSSIATAVNSQSIKSLPLIYPDKVLLARFRELITPLFTRIHNLTFENKDLTNLRDTLLPKLISGELEINEISK